MPRRVESIYSKRSEKPKTAYPRKPTAPLALSSTDRRDLLPRAHLRSPRAAPDPAIQDPDKAATLTQLLTDLTLNASFELSDVHLSNPSIRGLVSRMREEEEVN